MSSRAEQHRFSMILAFALVYFFWGSTYLGIGIAVEHIPPELMAGTRFVIAGAGMLLWCALRGRTIRLGWQDALRAAVVGILLYSQ